MRWILALLALHAAGAWAISTPTYVSSWGDDVNPCTHASPCRTFAKAMVATPDGGTIEALDDAVYGFVTITKPVTIDGGGHAAMAMAVSGTVVTIVTPGVGDMVVLRGLSIDGLGAAGAGIRALSVGKLVIEHCAIQNIAGHGIDFESSTNPSHMLVSDSTIANNINASSGASGVYHAAAYGTVALDRVRVTGNNIGVQVRASTLSIRDSTISGNAQVNVKLIAANASRIDIDNSLIADSVAGTGIHSQGLVASVYVSNSTITGNNQGLTTVIGSIYSFGNNRLFGNYTDGTFTTKVSLQ